LAASLAWISRCSGAHASLTASAASSSSTRTQADWPGRGDLPGQFRVDAVGQGGVGGDEQAGGQFVVLGLGDQVGGHVAGIRGVVGDDRYLGGAVLAVGAHHAAQHPLGRGHVDVARPGDDVGGRAVPGAVGEHRQRLRPAGRVHLAHAEQRARGQHGRVRQAAVTPLRRGRDRDRGDAGHLGRDDVHHDRGGVGDQAAGDVDASPAGRDVTAGDGEAVGDLDRPLGRQLGGMDPPGAPDRLFQGLPDLGVEPGQGVVQGLRRHHGGGQVDAVEAGRVLADGFGAAVLHVLAERADLRDGRLDVGRGARQDAGQGRPAEAGRAVSPQIYTAQAGAGSHPP
jgi:hypothetical protein